jgi:predicted RNA-binding Zn-ribbon protein involved in translation (DUF1610 family)
MIQGIKVKFSESKMLKVKGLQCDAPDCDYTDNTIDPDNYESYLNQPCPKCGEPLLTQQDLDTLYRLLEMEEKFIELGIPYVQEDEPTIQAPLKMNGTGKVEIGKPKIIK